MPLGMEVDLSPGLLEVAGSHVLLQSATISETVLETTNSKSHVTRRIAS